MPRQKPLTFAKNHWRLLLWIALIAAGVLLYRHYGLQHLLNPHDLHGSFFHIRDHVLNAGPKGIVVYLSVYIVFVTVGLPNLPFQLAAGAIYSTPIAFGMM